MSSHLIVGANRGIGLGLVKWTLEAFPEVTVYATARDVAAATDLRALANDHTGRVEIVQLDMLSQVSIDGAVATIKASTTALDMVIINAGILPFIGRIKDMPSSTFLTTLETNTVGPHSMAQAFYPFLLESKAIKRELVFISSSAGSFNQAPVINKQLQKTFGVDHFPHSGYAVSKGALNLLARHWAFFLEPQGVLTILVCPGPVATDMTLSSGLDVSEFLSVDTSTKAILDVLTKVQMADTSTGILSYDGSIIPW